MACHQNLNRRCLLEHCVFSPGVVAVVLGDAAVLVWTVETLLFVGTPLGTEVAVCIFVVLFPSTGLSVGNRSEEWGWAKASSGCPGCSVFPVAVKPCATGLENVANTDGSGADVPVWICKGKSCLSSTWMLNASFVLLRLSCTSLPPVREAGKSLVCFLQKQALLLLPLLSYELFLRVLPPQQIGHFLLSWTAVKTTELTTIS